MDQRINQSTEVIKAIQNMASSSGDSGMISKTKAIVPVHGVTSLSQTVDRKD